MLLIDTHVLVWLDEGNARLGKKSLQMVDRFLAGEGLAVCSISFWEVAMLVGKGRIELSTAVDVWRRELMERGLREVPLNGAIAIRAGELSDFHGDPADRIIVATALENASTLMTADERILSWSKLSQRVNARH